MIIRPTALSIATGILAGIIFSAFSDVVSGSLGVLYLPLLVLLLPGLSMGARAFSIAAIVASLIAMLLGGADNGVIFIVLIALPGFVFVRHILRHRGEEPMQQWYPALHVLTELTALAALFFMMGAALVAHDGGNLQSMIAHELTEGITVPPDPQITQAMNWLTGPGLFVLVAWAVWLWVLIFYGVAVLANSLLGLRSLKLRPSLTLTPAHLPNWLLGMLCAGALLSYLGHGADHFAGITVFLMLLLPYFLSGLSWLHTATKRWPGGKWLLILFYMAFFLLLWPAAFVIAAGLALQLTEMLDKGRRIG